MKLIIPFSSLIVLLFFCQCNREEDPAARLSSVVAEMNKKCPQVIDSETRLDYLEFKAPNTLRYNYTLLNLNVHLLDTHRFYLAMWPGLLSNIKVSREMKPLRDNKSVIEYYYQDKLKQEVYLFKIRPEDYN